LFSAVSRVHRAHCRQQAFTLSASTQSSQAFSSCKAVLTLCLSPHLIQRRRALFNCCGMLSFDVDSTSIAEVIPRQPSSLLAGFSTAPCKGCSIAPGPGDEASTGTQDRPALRGRSSDAPLLAATLPRHLAVIAASLCPAEDTSVSARLPPRSASRGSASPTFVLTQAHPGHAEPTKLNPQPLSRRAESPTVIRVSSGEDAETSRRRQRKSPKHEAATLETSSKRDAPDLTHVTANGLAHFADMATRCETLLCLFHALS
jgi:hypothetical protein